MGYIKKYIGHDRAVDTEDILQESFMRAYKALEQGTNVKYLRSWFFTTCKNTAINHCNKMVGIKKKALQIGLEVYHDRVREEKEEEIKERVIDSSLSEVANCLPETTRKIVLLRYKYGYSYELISRGVSISKVNVKERATYGIKKIRKLYPENNFIIS